MTTVIFEDFHFKNAFAEIGGLMAFFFMIFGALVSFIFPSLFMK